MSKTRKYVEAKEIEREMQAAREKEEFTGKIEQFAVKQMVESAKKNNRFEDKVLTAVNPLHVHIPEWQRVCDIVAAQNIGTHYDAKKWEVPKLLYYNGKFICVDGMHRIYGAFLAKKESVVCEIIECSLNDAIDLFLGQTYDRRKMSPVDYYRAAIANGDEKYIKLKEVCNRYNVAVKGDPIENQVGIFTSISDGIHSIKINGTDLLDHIIKLITDLQWNGYADTYNGKAYTAKFIRVMHKMYAYYMGRTEEMETILKEKCSGTEFFTENLIDKTQAQIFDALSKVVRYEMENPFKPRKKTSDKDRKAM